jgi:GNAT superfamily N-acetyltransferase
MPSARPGPGRPVIRPLTPARWPDLVELFGPRGAVDGCWCMWPRLTRADFARRKGQANRRAFRRIVKAGPPPGVLAYVNGVPAGWCAVSPREGLRRLERSRVMAPVDDRPVWTVTCFFIGRAYRGHGLAVRLLRAATALAARHGARLLEGHPTDPRDKRTPGIFLWTGIADTFRRTGFREVARRSPTRPVMRRSVRVARRADN